MKMEMIYLAWEEKNICFGGSTFFQKTRMSRSYIEIKIGR